MHAYKVLVGTFSLLKWSSSKLANVSTAIVSIAAVYWTDNIISENGGIYTRWIPDLDDGSISSTLRTSIKEVYDDAAWAYIVTWDKMRPNIANPYPTEVRTFSAILLYMLIKKFFLTNSLEDRYIYQKCLMTKT